MTPEERKALESIRLSWAPTPEDVWRPQTDLHVPGLHEHAMTDVLAAFHDAGRSSDSSPLGVIVHGPAGSGKTHLLGQVREKVQQEGGYFFLIRLLDAEGFWRSVLVGMLDDLGRPAIDHSTQLECLIDRLAGEAEVNDEVRRSVLGLDELTPPALETFVAAVYRKHPRHRRSSQHTLRALVLLSSADPTLQDTGDAYLQSIESVEPAEFARWGIRVAVLGHQGIAENISRLLAITGSTVLAVDQIDTLVAQSRTGADQVDDQMTEDLLVEQIAHGLMSLRETMCRTASVVSCLSAAWELIATRATASVQDRFRLTTPLQRIPSSDIGRMLLTRRFAIGYHELDFEPPYPTWPVAESAFGQAPDYTPRQLLIKADKHIRACLAADEVSELDSFDSTTGGDSVNVAVSPPSGLDELDARFAKLIAAAPGSSVLGPSVEDTELPALLSAGLMAWIHECQVDDDALIIDPPPGAKPALHARIKHVQATEAEEHWAFRAISATNSKAVLSRIQKACTSAGLAQGVAKRRLFLIRNDAWPSGPKTIATVNAFEQAGGRTVPLSIRDEAMLRALGTLLTENSAGLENWLIARKPAHDIALFRTTLAALASAGTPTVPDNDPPATPGPSDDTVAVPRIREPEDAELAIPPDSIPIGATVGSRRPVSVKLEALRKHTAIFAGSGSGKTVLIRRLVEECAMQGVSSIIIDPNNDLSRLGTAWPPNTRQWDSADAAKADDYLENTEVLVWTPRRTGGRPLSLQPLPDFAGVIDDPDELGAAIDSAVAALAPRANAVGGTSRSKLMRAVLQQTVQDFALRSRSSELADLIDLLENLPEGTSNLRDATVLAAELAENLKASTANDPLFGGSGSPMDPGLLLTPSAGKRARVSVINLSGLTSDEQRHGFVNQLQMALFAWIKKNPAGERPLGGLFVMDEAQNFAPSGKTVASTESTLALASQARKYGLGLVFATQSPKGLHNRIPGNASTQFYGLLNSPAQIDAAKEMARVKGGDVADIGRLPTGQFYTAIEGSGFQKTQTPLCLTYHPKSPPTEEEVLLLARGGAATD
ncbi:DUF87 domain-containing protein [Rhodococcus sp. IEGM 1409]|uniref:helicase HerA domain-containing protein n=1 Tax=Rhodococcus sp. IEGM 1409 TaxID=3047082 RepID=UPI0024B8572F|nr:DUF87 domain-containing protein [Rhodococcus sp. IEGM 1409]MDI9899403.1 DUF87 domain-containing protein [Rhodococcus sp. IEGM 1409]